MATTKNIAYAFLDGFGSLATILEPAQRPGSNRNLISSATSPDFSAEALSSHGTNLKDVVARLRRSADLIESSGDTLRLNAVKEASPVHGLR